MFKSTNSIRDFYIYKLIPIVVLINMPMHIFWEDNPYLIRSYLIAHEKSVKNKDVERDVLSWNIGTYVLKAIGTAFDSKNEYPTKPVSLLDKEKEQQAKIYREYERFMRIVEQNNQKYKTG